LACEYVSRVEEIEPAEELVFPATKAFGKYNAFLGFAVAHPAKMNTQLLWFLITRYTEPGETVLDPMAGTGSTGVVAALLGRDAIQVEIEPRFYEWMEEARRRVEAHQTLSRRGRITNILGDARALTQLLSGQTDAVLTSPPYADTALDGGDELRRLQRLLASGHDPRDFLGGVARNAVVKSYSRVGKVVPSPPYAGSAAIGNIDAVITNIGNLPLGPAEVLEGGVLGGGPDEQYRALRSRGRPTYLSEMLLVYREAYQTIRPGGYAIVVVKPYIRRRRVVDLPLLTWRLLELCGFAFEKVYKYRLRWQSFWRTLYYRKNPQTPRIAHEYVVVARKPADHGAGGVGGSVC